MGLFKTLQAKGVAREHEAVSAAVEAAQTLGLFKLEPDESVVAVVSGMGTKDLKGGAFKRAVAFGPGITTQNFLVVLTDQRLILLEAGKLGQTPKALRFADRREDVKVERLAPGAIGMTDLSIRRADGSSASLTLSTVVWAADAEVIRDELGSIAAPPALVS